MVRDRCMSPDTVHRIAQEIRHTRAKLTVEEKWAQRQQPSPMREDTFRRINFWRDVLKVAEHQLSTT